MPKDISHGWTTAQPDDPAYDVSTDELNDHTEVYSGLTAGHVLRASAATAADFAAIQDGDLPATIARDAEVTAAVAALSTVYQPLDSDLTSIAALATTAFGRSLLALANQAALLSAAGAAATTHAHAGEDITSGTVADGRVAATLARDAEVTTAVSTHEAAGDPHPGYLTSAEGNAAYQPVDADLTALAALAPANDDIVQRKAGAWANRTIAQLLTDLGAAGTTFQPLDADLTAIAALTTTSFGRGLLALADTAALAANHSHGGGTDDQTAAEVPFTPVGTIAATDTQAAVAEVATDAASALTAHDIDTTAVHGIADTSTLYRAGGTDVAVADGGTGASTATAARANLDVEYDVDVPSQEAFIAHTDNAAAHAASAIVFTPAEGIDSINVQTAIEEAVTDGAAALAAHTGDATDAHDASAISILDTANDFTATDVEGALAELQSDHEADATALSDHIADATDAHDASAISFTPNGSIAATDVQAAIQEVRDEAAGGGIPATIVDVKGDIIAATAADTVARLAAGANDTILMADSGETTGLKWVASQTPSTQAFADAAAQGTADTYARGDHKHAMPASPEASPDPFAAGTGFPGSPGTDDIFYRTDRDLIYRFDGTRWLCICPHELVLKAWINQAASDTLTNTSAIPYGAVYDIWMEKLYGSLIQGGGVSSTNYFTVTFNKYEASVASAIATLSTQNNTLGDFTIETAAIGSALGTTADALSCQATETGTATGFYGSAVLAYRFIG